MRRLRRIVISLLGLIFLVSICLKILPSFSHWIVPASKVTFYGKKVSASIAYQLSGKKKIMFPLATNERQLRIRTNLLVESYGKESFPPRYGIRVEILDRKRRVIASQIYYKNTNLSLPEKSENLQTNSFVLETDSRVTASDNWYVSLEGLKRAAFLQLRLIDGVDLSQGILVRVYALSTVSPEKRIVVWNRYSPKQQKSSVRSNVYPVSMLKRQEKENVVANTWKKIGPSGLEGKNYHTVRLYRLPQGQGPLIRQQLYAKKEQKKKIPFLKRNKKSSLKRLFFESGSANIASSRYVVPSEKELQQVEKLFERLFKGEAIETMKSQWKALQMNITEVSYRKQKYIVVRENPNKRVGRGFYVFRKGAELKKAVLQVPHRFYDIGTGLIGFYFMTESDFQAIAWNTVQRYVNSPNTAKNSDMAHVKNSYFNAFTRAFAKTVPKNVPLIQLHGYRHSERYIRMGKRADMVLSNGTRKSSPVFLNYAHLMRQKLRPNRVYLYSKFFSELAGLYNVNARTLRQEGNRSFFHVEMSPQLRDKFLESKKTRHLFLSCFEEEHPMHLVYENKTKKREKSEVVQ